MLVRTVRLSVMLVALCVGASRASHADPIVIYSTFGPAPGYSVPSASSPAYFQSDQNTWLMSFALSSAAYLTSITAPVLFSSQLPDAIAFFVQPSVGGLPDFSLGSTMDTLVVDVPANAAPGTVSMITATSSTQPLLAAGATYFLTMTSAGGFDVLGWPLSNAGGTSTIASLFQPPATLRTGTPAAFQLLGEPAENAPVPEPATMWLVAAGSGLLLRRLRRAPQ